MTTQPERAGGDPGITPSLGRFVDGSSHRCTYSPSDTDAADCGHPATWHIAWTVELDCGLACDTHMAAARRFPYLDRHPLSPDCAMPNARWHFDDQRCHVPGDDSPLLAAATQTRTAAEETTR
ncbi:MULTISPECIES: hypothetical protein [unclassified Streptomyces]|uniref:hypothetical protein n=1 Tax=unclassified Streptomyces TaxID=2593676 RepID=UPI0024A9DE17|nr:MULTISPECIES: hypothetical protein [unclassified Streptomyces]